MRGFVCKWQCAEKNQIRVSLKENLVAFHPVTNLYLNENLSTRDNHEKQIISPLYIASFLN